MGRRKDPPAVQKAKGFPNRRKAKTEQALAAPPPTVTPEEALLASLDIAGLRPPARFAEPRFADALAVWRALVPRLKQTARASAEFQAPLAAYCDSVARYNKAVADIEERGFTIDVTMTDGVNVMPRINPSERIRRDALSEILALSARFGFTPADNFALMIDHRKVIERGAAQGSLALEAPDSEAAKFGQGGAAALLGAMDSFDSAPPGTPAH